MAGEVLARPGEIGGGGYLTSRKRQRRLRFAVADASGSLSVPVSARGYAVRSRMRVTELGRSMCAARRAKGTAPATTRAEARSVGADHVSGYGLSVSESVPLEIPASDQTRRYLKAKKEKLGHKLSSV